MSRLRSVNANLFSIVGRPHHYRWSRDLTLVHSTSKTRAFLLESLNTTSHRTLVLVRDLPENWHTGTQDTAHGTLHATAVRVCRASHTRPLLLTGSGAAAGLVRQDARRVSGCGADGI